MNIVRSTVDPYSEVLYILYRYFVDEVRYLQDYMTVELLYQYSRQAIMKVSLLRVY